MHNTKCQTVMHTEYVVVSDTNAQYKNTHIKCYVCHYNIFFTLLLDTHIASTYSS